MLPSTTQLLKEEVVDVVANLVFNVAVVLPADLTVVLNDPADLNRDIGGKFRVSDAGVIEVAPCQTPECLRMTVIPKSRWRGIAIVLAMLYLISQLADLGEVGDLADSPIVEVCDCVAY